MKRKKSIIALLLVTIIGLTTAYFTNSTSVSNLFTTKEYGTSYTETFTS